MRRQLRQGTAPELALRKALHARGHRYRVAWPVPGAKRRTIDVAFTRGRVAVFVDGCFWHCCPAHVTWPGANAAWWADKLRRNVERDRETDELLLAAGWSVVRVWEHERVEEAVRAVEAALADRARRPAEVRSVDKDRAGVSSSEGSLISIV
jgi:DNA mismatch endonuclease (patch repair protein)